MQFVCTLTSEKCCPSVQSRTILDTLSGSRVNLIQPGLILTQALG